MTSINLLLASVRDSMPGRLLVVLIVLFGCAPAPTPLTAAPGASTVPLPASTSTVAATTASPAGAATPISSPAATAALILPTPAATAALVFPTQAATVPPVTRVFERIFTIVFENEGLAATLANPYFKQLAARGAYLSNYYAVSHPSEPNYLAMLAGEPLVADDGIYNLPQKNLIDLLDTAGIGWKAYQENYPGGCFVGSVAAGGLYARKHNPFISFDSIRGHRTRCAQIVNASELTADVAAGRLPPYSFFTPNMDHDGHDQPLSYAAKWFEGFIESKLSDPNFMQGTLLVVTFDESAGQSGAADNHVYTVLLGSMIKPGSVDPARYSHYSLLRSVEDNFHLGTLGRKDTLAQPFAACNFTGGCGR